MADDYIVFTNTDTQAKVKVKAKDIGGGLTALAMQAVDSTGAASNTQGTHFGSLGTVAHAASPGAKTLRYCRATNKNTTKRFLQVFDQVADLVGGETPLRTWEIPPGSATVSAERIVELADLGGGSGMAFALGLVWGISTTEATYTVATPADHIVDGYYN